MWIKTDFDFGVPVAYLTIGFRELAACGVRDALAKYGPEPNELEKAIGEIVRFYRPDLVGGSVVAIELGVGQACFRICYIHPSLKKKPEGAIIEEIPLIPQDWKKDHIKIEGMEHYVKLGSLMDEYEPDKGHIVLDKEKKYLVVGGPVISVTDGDRHFVGPTQLVDLYKVDIRECILVASSKEWDSIVMGLDLEKLIILRPDPTGKYQIPRE